MYTIKDIAKKAGVSASTTSRALNNNPRISQKTIAKVKKVASELGYRRDDTARNLTLGESNMVGVVFPTLNKNDFTNPFFIDLMKGISLNLQKKHYGMVVAMTTTQAGLLEQVQSMVEHAKVHNFIIFYSQEDDAISQYLEQSNINFVTIGKSTKYRYVDNDNILAGQKAAELLTNTMKAHYPIFVLSKNEWQYEKHRFYGYKKFMEKRKQVPKVIQIDRDYSVLNEFIKENPKTDSLIFSDDILYLNYLESTKEKDKFLVVCFNSNRLLGHLINCVRYIDLQPLILGKTASEVLFSNLNNKVVPFKVI